MNTTLDCLTASNKLDHGKTFDARQSAESCHDEHPSLRGGVLEGRVCVGGGGVEH